MIGKLVIAGCLIAAIVAQGDPSKLSSGRQDFDDAMEVCEKHQLNFGYEPDFEMCYRMREVWYRAVEARLKQLKSPRPAVTKKTVTVVPGKDLDAVMRSLREGEK